MYVSKYVQTKKYNGKTWTYNGFAAISSYCLHSLNSSRASCPRWAHIHKTQMYSTSLVKPIMLWNQVRKKIRRKSLILQYRVVYMHISWFIHISHTIVRTLRPKPLQKGLSSKASEKITHRLKVCSRAVGPLKATRLHHVPKAVSSTVLHPFPVKLGTSW